MPPATGLTVGDRPVAVTVPPGYRPGTPAPLLVMLHGYGGSGDREEAYVRLAPEAAAAGMLYARPEGTADTRGDRFWNADPACCDAAARPGPDRDLALSADVEAPGVRPLDGPETRVTSHPGCRPGGHAELWTVVGGDHAPALAPGYARQVVRFLLDHPKP